MPSIDILIAMNYHPEFDDLNEFNDKIIKEQESLKDFKMEDCKQCYQD